MLSLLKSFSLLFLICIFFVITDKVSSLIHKDEVFHVVVTSTKVVLSPTPITIVLPSPTLIASASPTLIPSVSPTLTPVPTITKKDFKFLIVGDSMILHGFGPQFEKDLSAQPNVIVVREGQYSTGLNRINYYDWYKETTRLLVENNPDYIVVMFGSNDGQTIKTKDGKSIQLYTAGWEEAYRQRIKDYMDLISPKVTKVIWIGHPIPGNNDFDRKFTLFNRIYEKESKNFSNILFIDTWDRFAINGKFSQIVSDDNGVKGVVKENDGVHLTVHGAKILSSFILGKVKLLGLIKN